MTAGTVVTQGRACLLGDVVEGDMRLNAAGVMANGVPSRSRFQRDKFGTMMSRG